MMTEEIQAWGREDGEETSISRQGPFLIPNPASVRSVRSDSMRLSSSSSGCYGTQHAHLMLAVSMCRDIPSEREGAEDEERGGGCQPRKMAVKSEREEGMGKKKGIWGRDIAPFGQPLTSRQLKGVIGQHRESCRVGADAYTSSVLHA